GAGEVKKKLMPRGAIQSRTDFGADGYGGPCPPAGDKPHHYQITVFAVDVDKLPDAKNDMASAAVVGFDLHSHAVAKATLTAWYGRGGGACSPEQASRSRERAADGEVRGLCGRY